MVSRRETHSSNLPPGHFNLFCAASTDRHRRISRISALARYTAPLPQNPPCLLHTTRLTLEWRLYVFPSHDHPPVGDENVRQQPRTLDFSLERVQEGVFWRGQRVVDVFQKTDELVRVDVVGEAVRLAFEITRTSDKRDGRTEQRSTKGNY